MDLHIYYSINEAAGQQAILEFDTSLQLVAEAEADGKTEGIRAASASASVSWHDTTVKFSVSVFE